MPKMNGIELAARVRGMDSHLPVLFMSGDAACGNRGLECVAKPFGPVELLETVSRVLQMRPEQVMLSSASEGGV